MKTLLLRTCRFLGSLRLTVVCLVLAMVLVFAGTLAQVEIGIYAAQVRYFRSLIARVPIPGIPSLAIVLPGGYLIGAVLLANLVCASLQRFALRRDRIGLLLIHSGLILLLLGQLVTDLFAVESYIRLSEGQGRNYSEDPRHCELAVIDTTAADHDVVVAIPDTVLARRRPITHPQLPFTLRIQQYWPNSIPLDTTNAPSAEPRFAPAPLETRADHRNIPTVTLEFLDGSTPIGSWVASLWLEQAQAFQYQGRTYRLDLRPARYYKPFTLELVEFNHDTYQGTDIPRSFSSEIRVINPATGENRQVRISMNNPLRYGGETFYQSGYDERDPRVTILQVVRNPGWLTPYVSCTLVGVGLALQFLGHLTGFLKRRTP
ncbi:MAG TPA: cytochrome c biogenesis protein ResB [Verrucomicrobiota bacterium]|nr:cytochrome c biogenesis protein ResB [Verrucomicrobiota bacterium]HNU52499.1 cytochrome c biogenesis protein ResB [Verrucomicrobiota bacterium]